MKILALEFSSPQRSVAVVSAPGNGGRDPIVASELIETNVSGASGLEMIDEVLRQSGFEREQIDCLAIGLGPGSYTGIRASIAIAQGWQLATGVKLCGISSAQCLAAQARAEEVMGRVNVVIDAQREEFYLSTYHVSLDAFKEIELLRIVTAAEVRKREAAGDILVGPEVTCWFAGGRLLFPRAEMLGRLAAERNEFVGGENLEPLYLRETKFVKAPAPRVF